MLHALPRYPTLYQINTRVWVSQFACKLNRPATLDDIPDTELDRLAESGFDWIYLLSVWQTGLASQKISRSLPHLLQEFRDTLGDLQEKDIAGSGFAITAYTVHEDLGGPVALARLRGRLRQRGLRLMLDFVPNHTALDHPWVEDHPEYYIPGTPADLEREPENFGWARRRAGDRIFAFGRDPFFPGWTDTLQLNYAQPAVREAMASELRTVAEQCDGVRCDMAMLILPEIFERTWKRPAAPFWPGAINQVRIHQPDFCFLAEVYWDLEWTLQQQGFDFTYDKRLYDRLLHAQAGPVRDHLRAGLDFQAKLARFLENHDEPCATVVFPPGHHQAAAIIAYLTPGLRFFHQGQLEGCRKRISPHLCRAPVEPVDLAMMDFYGTLLALLQKPLFRKGRWQLLEALPAWDGNGTWGNFVAFCWQDDSGKRVLAVVNLADHQGQCYLKLPFGDLGGTGWVLQDHLSSTRYERDGNDLQHRGFYLDVPAWQSHVFSLKKQ